MSAPDRKQPRKQVGRGYGGLLPPTDAARTPGNATPEQRRRVAVLLADTAIRADREPDEWTRADLLEVVEAMGLTPNQDKEWP